MKPTHETIDVGVGLVAWNHVIMIQGNQWRLERRSELHQVGDCRRNAA